MIQQNHYDPYGSLLAESSGGPAQPCKYNGKELDGELGLGLYDYQARNMDPVLGRFTTIEARPGGVTIYGSARDVGNWGAGFVAGKSGMSWQMARSGFDALQTYQKGIRNGWDVEGRPSQLAQQIGYRLGSWLYQQRNVQTNFRSLINRPTWSSNSY